MLTLEGEEDTWERGSGIFEVPRVGVGKLRRVSFGATFKQGCSITEEI